MQHLETIAKHVHTTDSRLLLEIQDGSSEAGAQYNGDDRKSSSTHSVKIASNHCRDQSIACLAVVCVDGRNQEQFRDEVLRNLPRPKMD